MVGILIDIPDELDKKIKLYMIENGLTNKADTIANKISEVFK